MPVMASSGSAGRVSEAVQTSFAHSHIVNNNAGTTDPAALFGTEVQFSSAVTHLTAEGGNEDGWDAIEHAIAEYDFRDDAVPVFVLLQGQEGRVNDLNRTLSHDGVLAALESKNVIFNSMIVGSGGAVFDLSPYALTSGDFVNQRVLGVEVDSADASSDGQHDYYLINQNTGALVASKPQTKTEAVQVSYNGSNTSESGMVDTGKSILIGQNIAGGIGGTAADNYRAKNVPYQFVDISSCDNSYARHRNSEQLPVQFISNHSKPKRFHQ